MKKIIIDKGVELEMTDEKSVLKLIKEQEGNLKIVFGI